MKRYIEKDLKEWKNKSSRKPLILKGARQTGKTHSLTLFGKKEFSNFHYLNFQKNKKLNTIFEENLDPLEIIRSIEFALNTTIDISKDLLFFDEIQDCPKAITSLKFFCEDLPEFAICCAGSLLGVTYSNEPFPVGKVETLNLYPMCFEEFLIATSDTKSIDIISNLKNSSKIPEMVHEHINERLKEYFVVGGLPEVIKIYADHFENSKLEAFTLVRKKQEELISNYISDFSKYSGNVKASEISALFESIPAQLSKRNKKFKPSSVVKRWRFRNLNSSIDWLNSAGLVLKCMISNSGELPFSAFTEKNRFNLYLFDVGLLGALANLSPGAIYTNPDMFLTFRGAFCENFVAQEFICAGKNKLYSYQNNTAEIEFLDEVDGKVYPIEVKSGKSGKLKSLNVFADKYPGTIRTRLSARNFEINESANMHSYPLYMARRIPLL